MTEVVATTWTVYRRRGGHIHAKPHIQAKNFKTLCGKQIRLHWGTDTEDLEELEQDGGWGGCGACMREYKRQKEQGRIYPF